MNHFKTPGGIELPLIDLQGQSYLKPAHRVVWFRESHPDWTVDNKIEQITDQQVIMKCEIKDETGRVRAVAHKTCAMDKKFPVESAETGAMGRALALCGFGTQFCDDFDVEDLADSPLDKPSPVNSSNVYEKYITRENGVRFESEVISKGNNSSMSRVTPKSLSKAGVQ